MIVDQNVASPHPFSTKHWQKISENRYTEVMQSCNNRAQILDLD